MRTRLQRWLAPPVFLDEEQTRIAALLRLLLQALIFIMALDAALLLVLAPETAPTFWINGAAILIGCGLLWLVRHRQVRLASVMLCLTLWPLSFYYVAISGALTSPSLAFLSAFIVVGATLFGTRGALVLGLLDLAGIGALYGAESAGLLVSVEGPPTLSRLLATNSVLYLLLTGLIAITGYSVSLTLKRARKAERALAERNRDLQNEIAERKQMEAALALERNLLRSVVDILPDNIFVKDKEGRILLNNPVSMRLLGVSRQEEALGKTDFDFFSPDIAAHYADKIQDLIRSGRPIVDQEEFQPWQSDHWRWQVSTVVPLRDDHGSVIGLVGRTTDISERKRAEEALRLSEKRFSTVFHSSPIAISISRIRDGRFIDVNEAHQAAHGYSREELFSGAVTSRDMWLDPQLRAAYEEMRHQHGEVRQFEFAYRRKSGAIGVALLSSEQIELEGELHSLSFALDITERKRAEEALKQSEAAERDQRVLAQALRDTAEALVTTLDPDEVMIRILDNVGRVVPHDWSDIGLIEGDCVRIVYLRGWPPDEEAALRALRLPLTTGSLHTMLSRKEPLFIADTRAYAGWVNVIPPIRSYAGAPIQVRGQVIGFLRLASGEPGFFTADHAEHLQAFANQAGIALENAQLYERLRVHAHELEQRVAQRTAELRRTKEHVEAILDNSSDGIVVVRADGSISQINRACSLMFGYTPEEFTGRTWKEFVDSDQAVALEATVGSLRAGSQTTRFELEARRKDGTPLNVEIGMSQVGEPEFGADRVEFVCNIRDITLRKQAEAELQRAFEQQKELVELKSHFVAMASHDFRTPLSVILTSSYLLETLMKRAFGEDQLEPLRDHFRRIRDSVQQMTELLDGLLAVNQADAGKLELAPERIDLTCFCQEVLQEIQLTASPKHTFTLSLSGDTTRFVSDRRLLQQILVNLLSNAVKYSPRGGSVALDVQCEPARAQFRVQDEGIGIPEPDRSRLFETFHRASNVGSIKGTGLGMAITKRALEALGGQIGFESQLGVGTTFTVSIPAIRP